LSGQDLAQRRNPPVGVLAVAGRNRLALDDSEGTPAVGLPLGAKEQGRRQLLLVEPVRRIEEMCHKEDHDAAVQQRPDDLPGDLGALSLVWSPRTTRCTATWSRGVMASAISLILLSSSSSDAVY
jgi:hypothetical protein